MFEVVKPVVVTCQFFFDLQMEHVSQNFLNMHLEFQIFFVLEILSMP